MHCSLLSYIKSFFPEVQALSVPVRIENCTAVSMDIVVNLNPPQIVTFLILPLHLLRWFPNTWNVLAVVKEKFPFSTEAVTN